VKTCGERWRRKSGKREVEKRRKESECGTPAASAGGIGLHAGERISKWQRGSFKPPGHLWRLELEGGGKRGREKKKRPKLPPAPRSKLLYQGKIQRGKGSKEPNSSQRHENK